MDVDKLLWRPGKDFAPVAAIDDKLHGERWSMDSKTSQGYRYIGARFEVPTFVLEYEPERLRYRWSALDERARGFLTSLPHHWNARRSTRQHGGAEWTTSFQCVESVHQRVLGELYRYEVAKVEEWIAATRAMPLLQTPGMPLVRYKLEAFQQRSGYYANAHEAFQLATLEYSGKPATVSVVIPHALPLPWLRDMVENFQNPTQRLLRELTPTLERIGRAQEEFVRPFVGLGERLRAAGLVQP